MHRTNFWKLLELFSPSCWLLKYFPLQKVVEMLEKVVVGHKRSSERGG